MQRCTDEYNPDVEVFTLEFSQSGRDLGMGGHAKIKQSLLETLGFLTENLSHRLT